MEFLRSLKPCSALALVGMAVACGKDTTDPEPSDPVINAVSGSGQTGTVGAAVSNPLVVRITQDGTAVSGRSVAWTVTGGGGNVSPASSTTDASGDASTTWTLGATAGANLVEAAASGVSGTVQFTATGVEDASPPQEASIDVQDNVFVPAEVTIAAGGTVTWTWNAANANPHDVTFQTGASSATQDTGTFVRSFADAGDYDYLCTVHGSSMSGTIHVVAN